MAATPQSSSFGLWLQAGNSIAGAYSQYAALKMQGEYQTEMSKINARFADIYAKDALSRGEKAVSQKRLEGADKVSSQRVSAAAQGIAVDQGSSFDAQRDIEEATVQDVETIRNNAWREAWGFRTQAALNQGASAMQTLASNNQANSTLLTGGLNALAYSADAYNSRNKNTPAKKVGE